MNSKSELIQLLRMSFAKKRYIAASVVCSLVSAILQLVPYLAAYLILVKVLEDMSGIAGALEGVAMLAWLSLGAIAAAGLTLYAASALSHLAAYDLICELRLSMIRKLSEVPLGQLDNRARGEWKGIVMDDTERLEGFIAHYLPDVLTAFFYSAAMLVFLFALEWKLAVFLLIPAASAFHFQWNAFRSGTGRAITERFFNSIAKMNGTMVEYVQGLPLLKAFNQTVFSFRRFADDVKSFTKEGKAYSLHSIPSFALFLVALPSAFVFIVPVGAYRLSAAPDYAEYATTLFLFLLISNGLFIPILKLMYVGSRTRQMVRGLDNILNLMKLEPLPRGTTQNKPDTYDLHFDRVCFQYGESMTLREVSFHAIPGKVTALVGPSGAGKSTIAGLAARFWDVTGGCIRIGGCDIRQWAPETLYDCISFVFQDNPIFTDTVMNNIRMGRKDALDEEVISAAKSAQCHAFIQQLPEGYAAKLGAGGVRLSGGERQRIAIARLILKDSPIVILDEATAFADANSEYEIQQALSALIQHKTVLVIAHRLHTIMHADQILVLDQGSIVERGHHDFLVNQNGLYASMWHSYQDGLEWTIRTKEEQA